MATPLGRGRSFKRRDGAATIGICSHREQKRSTEQVQQGALLTVCSNKKRKRELNDLPTELLSNILSRIPLTHLLESAKHTCKLWNSIINEEPQFSEIHFSRSLGNPGYLYTLSDDSGVYFLDYENTKSRMRLPIQLKKQDNPKIVSCWGILCYRSIDEKCVYICNPVTGECAIIPTPPNPGLAALGYALLSKRCKYVQFFYKRSEEDIHIEAEILTLGEDLSARKLPFPPAGINMGRSIAYCNGSVHFTVIEESGDACLHRVMSLDIETEKFGMSRILHSGSGGGLSWPRIYVTVLGENVAFVVCSESGFQQVWMLIDEGEDIWVEKYRFNVPTPGVEFQLRGLWFNGDLYGLQTSPKLTIISGSNMVISTVSRYFSYNIESGKYDVLRLPCASDDDEDGSSPWSIVPHVGSLLPLSKLVGGVHEYSSF